MAVDVKFGKCHKCRKSRRSCCPSPNMVEKTKNSKMTTQCARCWAGRTSMGCGG